MLIEWVDSSFLAEHGVDRLWGAEVDVDARATITRELTGHAETLAQTRSEAMLNSSGENTLELECSFEEDEANIVFSVNGRQAVAGRDHQALAPFDGVQMRARTRAPGLEVFFDSIRVAERPD